MDRPLVALTVFYAAGILLGGFTGFKASAALALAFFCFLAAAAGHFRAWRGSRRALLVLFLLLGLALSRLQIEAGETLLVDWAGQRVTLVGRVAAGADLREDKVFYLFQVRELIRGQERREMYGTVRLQVTECRQVYGYGDILKVSGLLTRPDPPGNPGAFNYRRYLERQGLRAVLLARGDAAVQKVGRGGSNPVTAAALRVKEKLSAAATASLTPSQAAVLNGIVFGVQGLIDRETRQVFSETGVVHILSVSGLHVGLLLGGILGLLRLLGLPPALTAPLATPLLIFYAVMTGLVPAVIRATIMALLFLWAHHLGRERDWPTTLAVAGLAILLWRPLELYNPGFQLSFAATWGILYLGPLLSEAFAGLLKGLPAPAGLTRGASLGLAVPLAAQLATVPLVAWYYNMITPVAILANLLATPLVGLVLFLGILAALLGQIWLTLAWLINAGNGVVLDLFLALVGLLQRLPGAVYYLATPPVFMAVVWYAGLLAAGRILAGGWDPALRQRLKGWAAVGAALAVALLLIWWPWPGEQRLTVHFLDVGQGDCILVQTPGGKNMLIDAGGRKDEFQTGSGAGDQVVVPYLRRIGVQRLDALVLTHPHEDHAGGAAAVVKSMPVGLAVVSPVSGLPGEEPAQSGETTAGGKDRGGEVPPAYRALLKKLKEDGVPVQAAVAGDVLKLEDGLGVEFLSPGGGTPAGLNDSSLVLKLTYGRRSFLLTGDVELESQRRLLSGGEDLNTDVFKLPHHGSRTLLPELVEAVSPEVAVISVGAHNTFGHPALSTLDLLDRSGAEVYRTDVDGAVIVSTDGERLDVKRGRKGL